MVDATPPATHPDCNCSALRQAARCVTRLYDEALAPVGLGVNQFAILAKLERFGPQGLGELAGLLVMDRSTVGHLLRPLERRGLVTIEAGPTDGRKRLVALSAGGRGVVAEAKPFWAAAQARFEDDFGVEEARAMRSVLARVVTADSLVAPAPDQEMSQ